MTGADGVRNDRVDLPSLEGPMGGVGMKGSCAVVSRYTRPRPPHVRLLELNGHVPVAHREIQYHLFLRVDAMRVDAMMDRKPRPPKRWVVAATGTLFVLGTVATAFTGPILTFAPLLLVALSPIHRNVLLVARVADPGTLFAVVMLRRLFGNSVVYFFAQTFGERGLEVAAEKRPRLGRFLSKGIGVFDRGYGAPLVVLAPNATPLLAGASKMSYLTFVVATVLGQAWVILLTVFLADYFKAYIDAIVVFVRANWVAITVVTVALVVAQLQYKRWRKQRTSSVS